MLRQFKGLWLILLADLLWGLQATLAKHLFNQQVSPFDLIQLRLTLSALLLCLYLLVVRPRLLAIRRRDLPYMIVLGIFGISLVQLTYLYTISQTNVATAVFLQYLAPSFILLYELLTRRGVINAVKVSSLLSATLGGLLIVKGNLSGGLAVNLPGLISGLASAVTFAFYTIYGKIGLSRYSPWTLLAWGMGTGSLVWAGYRLPWISFFSYGPGDWLFFFYIAVFGTIIPFGLFLLGLQYLTPVVAGITSTMEPVLAGILGYLILGEVLTGMQLLGCSLVIAAVVAAQFKTEPAGQETAVNGP
ncbi:MAG: DMT family transporter [Syntrophomonadaceae bacterium]|nr:DMT family transporter [Syntrophomonadaceae bacterium]